MMDATDYAKASTSGERDRWHDRVKSALVAWGEWSRRDGGELGYASRSVEGRMMDDGGWLPRGTRTEDRRVEAMSEDVQIVEQIVGMHLRAGGERAVWAEAVVLKYLGVQHWRRLTGRRCAGACVTDEQRAQALRMSRKQFDVVIGRVMATIIVAMELRELVCTQKPV